MLVARRLLAATRTDRASSVPGEILLRRTRVEHVTESLRREGILDGWRVEADGYHLTNMTCPYRKAAEVSTLPCDSDRKAIELLLGLEVQQLNRIVDGSPVCEYLVRALNRPQLIEVS